MTRFNLTNFEETAWKEWIKGHKDICTGFEQELGFGNVANYSVCFSPGMVGDVVRIRCDLCGKELDITDYDSW